MKQIPILFSTPMVQAILEGRKTQTRRIMKCKRIPSEDIASVHPDGAGKGWVAWAGRAVSAEETRFVYPGDQGFKCPYGAPGDILWVRETWRGIDQDYGQPRYEYKAMETINVSEKWKPSIHMPKEAARIWLQVESVRVERLQDITEDDAIAEGVEKMGEFVFPYKHYESGEASCIDAKTSFRTLWQAINGDESWVLNPWVWVISFKVLSITGKPSTNVI